MFDFDDEENEVDFICPCPVQGCSNNDTSKRFKWVHSGCGGNEKLNDKGYLRCKKCGENGPMIDWRFNCGEHDYKPASLQGLLNGLYVIGNLKNVSQSLILKITDSFIKQYNK